MSYSTRNRLYLTSSRNFLRVFLLILVSGVSLAVLIVPIAIRPSAFPLKIGDVASQDLLAPRTSSFTSVVLTEQARQDAESKVQPIYLPADHSITRKQIERLRVSLDYISSVRQDAYSNHDQKISDLLAMQDLHLERGVMDGILGLSESRWQVVRQQASDILEQTMRNSIREDQVEQAKNNVPTLVSFSLPQDQAILVADLVTPFVVPNSLYSESQTAQARIDARASVSPVIRSFVSGESIVRRGQVITPASLEALQQFGLVQSQNNDQNIISASTLVVLLSAFIGFYFNQRKRTSLDTFTNQLLISIWFLLFLYSARIIIPNRTVIPYIFPISAFGMTLASLFTTEIGLVFSIILCILTAYGLPGGLELTIFYSLSSVCGILVLGKGRRISSFFWAGLAIGGSSTAVLLAYHLSNSITDWVGIATLIGAAFFNGIASASLTLLFQFLFSQMLGLTTSLQLLEISRSDHPLMQFLLRTAPGTYQHSLQVANLAEQAAEEIGADALLTRVGAIYHDCGKALNPSYFVENQIPAKINPHDEMDPVTSAATIIQHVSNGILLAKKHHLPPPLQAFINEHHGTLLTRYQYTRAVMAAENDVDAIDAELFRYPGPRPNSRETALIMLADGCEARARAELPKDEEELRILVKKVFDYIEHEGQLDNTTMTLKDLSISAESFIKTLRNTYHPRLQYPELKTSPASPEIDKSESQVVESPSTPVNSSEITR
jgi:putative nucleotidyltransferase with HDIG domain